MEFESETEALMVNTSNTSCSNLADVLTEDGREGRGGCLIFSLDI